MRNCSCQRIPIEIHRHMSLLECTLVSHMRTHFIYCSDYTLILLIIHIATYVTRKIEIKVEQKFVYYDD